MSDLLKKPTGKLSKEEKDSLKKELSGLPMTALAKVKKGTNDVSVSRVLGTLKTPMVIFSEKSQDEIEGTLIRDMPTPEMLDMQYKLFSYMAPDNIKRVASAKGQPGSGKTFLGELAGRVTSDKGAIKVDCTGINCQELFFETVLDFKGDADFYKKLNERIDGYNKNIANEQLREEYLHPNSVNELRESLGDAFSEDSDGRIKIDWGFFQGTGLGAGTEQDTLDADRIHTSGAINKAREGLHAVGLKQGLLNSEQNTLGMATQPGVAVKAFLEGRLLILDEINRAKEGTFGILHSWTEVIVGNAQECVLNNPLQERGSRENKNIRLNRDEMGAGHFVFWTSNEETDSSEVNELPEALYSRVKPFKVPTASLDGWQHRWCQKLTGLPISTLYRAEKKRWDEDPDAFGQQLLEWRRQGESREIPGHQLNLIKKWEDVMEAGERLASFFYDVGQLIDEDSDYHRAGDLDELLDQLDTIFRKELAIDYRKVNEFSREVFTPKPIIMPTEMEDSPEISPLLDGSDMPEDIEDISTLIGTHLQYTIIDWIVANSYDIGKDELGKRLLEVASKHGIIAGALNDSIPSERRDFRELLDDKPYDSSDVNLHIALARDIVCDHLRSEHPDLDLPENYDDIIPLETMAEAMKDAGLFDEELELEEDVAGQAWPETPPTITMLCEMDTKHGVEGRLLPTASVIDTFNAAANDNGSMPLSLDQLLSIKSFLPALAVPELRERNLSGLWRQAISESGRLGDYGRQGDEIDRALSMAEGGADTPVFITTLKLNKGAKESSESSPVHVVWNKAQDRVLIVGEGAIDDSLRLPLHSSRARYIDRNAENAERETKKALSDVLGEHDNELNRQLLKDAFLMRNGAGHEGVFTMSLEKLLLDDDVKSDMPQYIVKSKPGVA